MFFRCKGHFSHGISLVCPLIFFSWNYILEYILCIYLYVVYIIKSVVLLLLMCPTTVLCAESVKHRHVILTDLLGPNILGNLP
jgi:hypothetical protein